MLNTIQTKTTTRNIIRIALVTGGLLLIPLLGNWPWTLGDFVIAGVLLFGTGLVYELLIKRVRDSSYRIYLAIALAIAFLLVWAELAVGLFGTPFAGS
jgi:hypothetical protein